MKESKKFFYNDKLNKGHSGYDGEKQQSQANIVNDNTKGLAFFPSLELLEHYEEQYPGTVKKIIDLAQKEQAHRHLMDLKILESNKKIALVGKICATIIVAITALGILGLAVALENIGVLIAGGIVALIATLMLFKIYKQTPAKHGHNKHSHAKQGAAKQMPGKQVGNNNSTKEQTNHQSKKNKNNGQQNNKYRIKGAKK